MEPHPNAYEVLMKLKSEFSKAKKTTCKHAAMSIVGDSEKGFEIINKGCINPRRNGSAYCQGCSDIYHVNLRISKKA